MCPGRVPYSVHQNIRVCSLDRGTIWTRVRSLVYNTCIVHCRVVIRYTVQYRKIIYYWGFSKVVLYYFVSTFYTLTSGNKITTKHVTFDKPASPSRHWGYRPISEMDLPAVIWLVGYISNLLLLRTNVEGRPCWNIGLILNLCML